MTINWSLIGDPPDIGAKFQEGWDRTEAKIKQSRLEQATQAYAANPTDPNALGALAAASPQFAMSLGNQRAEQAKVEAERTRRGGYFQGPDMRQNAQRAFQGGDIEAGKQILALGEDQQKQVAAMYKAAAPIAYQLRQASDPAQRSAMYAKARPILEANGWPADKLDSFDPNDNVALDAVIAGGQTIDQLIDQGKIRWVQQGEQPSFATDAMGRPVGAQNPYAGGNPAPAAPPPVLSDDDIARLRGGQSPPATGTFPDPLSPL